MSEPLLDLSTLAPDRPIIRIDGTDYQMHVMTDFGAVDLYHVRALGNAALAIQRVKEKDYTEQHAKDFSENLSQQVQMVLIDLPDEVLEQLTDRMKGNILEVFSKTAAATEEEVAGEASRQTGEKLSPDSNDSMEATPEDGST